MFCVINNFPFGVIDKCCEQFYDIDFCMAVYDKPHNSKLSCVVEIISYEQMFVLNLFFKNS